MRRTIAETHNNRRLRGHSFRPRHCRPLLCRSDLVLLLCLPQTDSPSLSLVFNVSFRTGPRNSLEMGRRWAIPFFLCGHTPSFSKNFPSAMAAREAAGLLSVRCREAGKRLARVSYPFVAREAVDLSSVLVLLGGGEGALGTSMALLLHLGTVSQPRRQHPLPLQLHLEPLVEKGVDIQCALPNLLHHLEKVGLLGGTQDVGLG